MHEKKLKDLQGEQVYKWYAKKKNSHKMDLRIKNIHANFRLEIWH